MEWPLHVFLLVFQFQFVSLTTSGSTGPHATLGIKGAEPLGTSVHTATPAHRHAARTFAIWNIQRAGQAVNHPALPSLAFAIRTQDDRARITNRSRSTMTLSMRISVPRVLIDFQ